MNQILKLINTRELYTHLIMFKVYLDTKGQTNKSYNGNLQKEVQNLFGDEFDYEDFSTALNYLFTEGYTKYYSAQTLTANGRRYFEDWIYDFIELTEEEKTKINENLPEKIKTYLGIAKDALVVIKNAKDLLEHFGNN